MKKMDVKRYFSIIGLIGFMSFMMTNFQNCAPSPMQMQAGSDNLDANLRIVDDWQSGKLLFVQPTMSVSDQEQDVVLHGVCDRSAAGDVYNWSFVDEDGVEINYKGDSQCEGGGFRIALEGMDTLGCGIDYRVIVSDNEGHEDQMLFKKNCSI